MDPDVYLWAMAAIAYNGRTNQNALHAAWVLSSAGEAAVRARIQSWLEGQHPAAEGYHAWHISVSRITNPILEMGCGDQYIYTLTKLP